jgi:DNA-binding transcriptional MerR regulator
MSEAEIVYTSNEVYSRLGVSGSTLRKYSDVLEREGYDVRKNSRGRREYTEFDVLLIEQLVELSKQDGMTLEKAAKMIAKQFGIDNKKEESQGTDPVPYQMQYQFQQQYSAMIEEINKVQQANLLEMEKRLGNRIDQRNKLIEEDIKERNKLIKEDMKDRREREERIEKRLGLRDENLMKMVREIQDAKRTIVSSQEEIAAARSKKNSWWMFWK